MSASINPKISSYDEMNLMLLNYCFLRVDPYGWFCGDPYKTRFWNFEDPTTEDTHLLYLIVKQLYIIYVLIDFWSNPAS